MRKTAVALGFFVTLGAPVFVLAAPGNTPEHVTNSYLPAVKDPARAAGLRPLSEVNLASGNKEIRIWVGFGVISAMQMIRLVSSASGAVSGEAFYEYPRTPKDADAETKDYFEDIERQCKPVDSYGDWRSCHPKFSEKADWQEIYKSLQNLDVWKLPDESTLPKPELAITDGAAIFVELRDGSTYRAYEYSNPSFNTAPEAQKASKMLAIASELTWVDVWPKVAAFHHTYHIEQSAMPVIKATIDDVDGQPLYLFICRSGDDDSVPDVNYSGSLDCRLMFYEDGEVETSLLVETHNERTPAWYSRGRMIANELYGKCAEYPEYGAVRHFSLRRMAVTLSYGDIKFSPAEINGQPILNSYELTVDIAPDDSATTDIAKASGYIDPSRQNYDCSKIVKGIDMPDTHKPWPQD